MQGLFLLLIYIILFVLGLARPFVLAIGYVWTDLFTPQAVNSEIFESIPASMIMGAGAFVSFLLFARKDALRPTITTFLLIAFGGWMTLTLTWAAVPEYAWIKWDWAVKTVLFSAFLPFFFRSRVQIEALVLTVVFSVSGIAVPVGIKTLLTGGGYGWDVTPIFSPGAVLGEGNTLSLCAVMIIPLINFVARHSLILPWRRIRVVSCAGLVLGCIAAALGTFARTGLVSLITLGILLLWQTKRRVLVGTLMLLMGSSMLPVVGPAWMDRMQTIDSSEASAEGRIYAWNWALQYVLEHPLGGGLDAYRINAPAMRDISGGTITTAKATHSIYFEVLSETGFVGFAIWSMIIMVFYRNMYRLWKKTKGIEELEWLRYLLKSLVISMTVFLVGGAFLSIAFIPLFYYVVVLGLCLCEHHRVWQMDGQSERSLYFELASVRTPRGSAPA